MARSKKEDTTTTTQVVKVITEYGFGKPITIQTIMFFLSTNLPTTLRMIADTLDAGKIEEIGGSYRLVK